MVLFDLVHLSPVRDSLLFLYVEQGRGGDTIRSSGRKLLLDSSISFLDPHKGSLMTAVRLE